MSSSAGKHKQRYIDCPSDRLKLTCLIHDHGHSVEQCKFLNNFGTRYDTRRPFKEIRQEPTSAKKYNKTRRQTI